MRIMVNVFVCGKQMWVVEQRDLVAIFAIGIFMTLSQSILFASVNIALGYILGVSVFLLVFRMETEYEEEGEDEDVQSVARFVTFSKRHDNLHGCHYDKRVSVAA